MGMRIILLFSLIFAIKALTQNYDTIYSYEFDTTINNFGINILKNYGILKINSNEQSIDNLNKIFSEFNAGFNYEITKKIGTGFIFSIIHFQKIDTIILKKFYNFGIRLNYMTKNTEKTNINFFFIPSISTIQFNIPSKNKVVSNTIQLKAGCNFDFKIAKKILVNINTSYSIQNFRKFVSSFNTPYKINNGKNFSIKFSGISVGVGTIINVY